MAIFAPRGHPGAWEQQDGLEVVNNRILIDFGVISGLVYVSFWGPECLFFFVRACFRVIFFMISDSKFGRLGLPDRGFRMQGIAKIDFSWKSFLMNFGNRFLLFFDSLGHRFSDFLSLGNRFENKGIFCDVTDPEPSIWWVESPRYLGPLKT